MNKLTLNEPVILGSEKFVWWLICIGNMETIFRDGLLINQSINELNKIKEFYNHLLNTETFYENLFIFT